MSNFLESSWFMKYQPKVIDDYVFETEELKSKVITWVDQGYIDGNILLAGKPGTGKSALTSILVHSCIKSSHDLNIFKSRSVTEVDELYSWVAKRPISSKKKIIVMEEFDRLSGVASTQLKDGLLEKFQNHVTFIATTNYLNRIQPALQDRFNYKIIFEGTNYEDTLKRLKQVLTIENVQFDETKLTNFVIKNYKSGLRKLLTFLQVNSINGQLQINDIDINTDSNEEIISSKTLEIMNICLSCTDNTSKKLILFNPLNSIIKEQYSQILELVQYSQDLHYETIYLHINDLVNFLPIKFLISKYLEEHDNKRIPYLHYISFISELIERCLKIM
jgi:DNA polymerase III delta prime subunit